MKKVILFLIVWGLFLTEIVAQCPMCKASVESGRASNEKNIGNGLNTGILMLLASVYIVATVIGILWYKNYRKSNLAS